ncbi:glycosyltransferase family 4 protein [Microcella alkaliphila]|uniref:glycosyltransferase family 4 protein n=1 Tax=Microcella alkaliphila TaxID=279828 RepID=UPI0013747A98|nr:glycosyltransferase family 4 protein [Microcella alkaliphila]
MLVYFVNHSSAIDHLGGSERSLLKLIDDWIAAEPTLEPYFITRAPAGLLVEELRARSWAYSLVPYSGWAVPPHEADCESVAYRASKDYLAVKTIRRLMESRRPDLVVTNTLVAPWGAFVAQSLGIPHAWIVREFGDLDHGLRFVSGREQTLTDIGRLSELVVVNSHAVKKHLQPFVDAKKLVVVYPTVDSAQVQVQAAEPLAARAFPERDAGLKITVVGRLAPSKGQWRVVEALGELHRRGFAASVCLVGASMEPDHPRKLRSRSHQLGVADYLSIVGEQSNPWPFCAAADVCVTPSTQEAFGRTTLEYLWLGKPVIATNSGGSAELVKDTHNGFLFDADAPGQLADRLQRYIEAPDLLRLHALAARQHAESLASPEWSNLAAIERLSAVASAVPRSSGDVADEWFAKVGYRPGRSRLGVIVRYRYRRLVTRTRNFLTDPVGSVRRKLRRAEHPGG